MALRDVNRKLALIDKRCELVNNGDGYLYFSFVDDVLGIYESRSVYVCYFKDNTDAEWLEIGTDFIRETLAKITA